jgi:hypothetical protein
VELTSGVFGDFDRWSEESEIESSARGEYAIAEGLGVESPNRLPRVPTILRIERHVLSVRLRGLSIDRRRHDPTDEPLKTPIIAPQGMREFVEEFGMRRSRAESPEVAEGCDDAATEEMRPHAIRDHASGERVRVRHDPPRERDVASRRRKRGIVERDAPVTVRRNEDAQSRWPNDLPRLAMVTAVGATRFGLVIRGFDECADEPLGGLLRAKFLHAGVVFLQVVHGGLVVLAEHPGVDVELRLARDDRLLLGVPLRGRRLERGTSLLARRGV